MGCRRLVAGTTHGISVCGAGVSDVRFAAVEPPPCTLVGLSRASRSASMEGACTLRALLGAALPAIDVSG